MSHRFINLALIMAASGIRGFGQWLFVFLLIRVSGPENVGVYGLATALVTPVIALTGLQLPRVIATEKSGERDLGSYVAVRLLGIIFNAVVLIPLVLIVSNETLWPVAALVLQTGAMGLVEIYQASLLQQSRLRMYGAINLLMQAVTWFGAAIVLYITHDMALALAISGIAMLVTYGVVHVALSSYSLPPVNPTFFDVRSIVWENLPLGLALLVDALATHSPRFLLESAFGKFELGIFVGLLTFLSASTLVTESVGQAATPWVTRLVHGREPAPFTRFVRLLTLGTVTLATVVPLVAWWVGPVLASVLLESVYGDYPFAISGVAFIAVLQFGNRFTVTALNAAKSLRPLFGVNVVSLIAVIIVGFLVIPAYGVDGAMGALISANLVKSSALQWMVRKLQWNIDSQQA